jgi:hypothetical protein
VALNPAFDFFNYEPTQTLLHDLIIQAIQIYGHEVIYIPRNIINYDQLYETYDQSMYNRTIPIEVYIENVDGFQGQRDIFTKFGLEIKDSVTLVMARRTFEDVIKPITNQPRPLEGDLIFFTMNRKCFQIAYVNNKELFYPLGTLPTYQMELNLFEFSEETFNTGIPEIDSIQKNLSLNTKDYELILPDGTELADNNNNTIDSNTLDVMTIEPLADNTDLSKESISYIDFNANSPFGGLTK